MARIPYADPDAYAGAVRDAMEMLPPLNVFRMLAHAETAFPPYLRMASAILTELELDPGLRELAILQVAKQSEAEYEWIQHVALARHAGLEDEQIEAVRTGEFEAAECLSSTQRALLAFTAAVVADPRTPDATFDRVRDVLNSREIVELLLTIGSYLMLARLMTTLEIELDPAASEQLTPGPRSDTASKVATFEAA